jgi:hypothetical protein
MVLAHAERVLAHAERVRSIATAAQQQSKPCVRRCDGCVHYSHSLGSHICEKHTGENYFFVTPDWFCADFTLKEG